MIKIERTYRYYCCNSCGKQDSDQFPVLMIRTGIDGSKQSTCTSYCRDCLKKLQLELNKVL